VRHCSRISEPMKPVAPVRTIFTMVVVLLVVAVSFFLVWVESQRLGVCGSEERRKVYVLEARKLVELAARRDGWT
jgi:hypothetical protein